MGYEIQDLVLPDGTPWRCPRVSDTITIWQEIFVERAYEDAARRVRASGTIIDVGAHTGLAALYFARKISDVRIFAFEPAHALHDCLSANLRGHVPSARVSAEAVGNSTDPLAFAYYPLAPSQSGVYANSAKDRQASIAYLVNSGFSRADAEFVTEGVHVPALEVVQSVTLSSIFSRYDELREVDLIKIDVERAELDVLKGIDQQDWPRINSLVLEVHDEGNRMEECVELLRHVGFAVEVQQVPWLARSDLFSVTAVR